MRARPGLVRWSKATTSKSSASWHEPAPIWFWYRYRRSSDASVEELEPDVVGDAPDQLGVLPEQPVRSTARRSGSGLRGRRKLTTLVAGRRTATRGRTRTPARPRRRERRAAAAASASVGGRHTKPGRTCSGGSTQHFVHQHRHEDHRGEREPDDVPDREQPAGEGGERGSARSVGVRRCRIGQSDRR